MKHHPEQSISEIYMGNTTKEDFEESRWRTKRMSNPPLNDDGSRMDSGSAEVLRPWFIQRSEVEARMPMADEIQRREYQRMLSRGRTGIDS